MKNCKIAGYIKTVVLYVMFFLIMIFILSQKKEYHVDELLTYNLANAESWFSPVDGVTYSPADEPFVAAMASNGTFELGHIWRQQENDTHPPFYYVLVHAVCVLFPGKVSMRYAGAINILFALLTLFLYRKILYRLVDDEKVVFVLSIAFCLSGGILGIIPFLRMYVMVMFFVTAIAFVVIDNIEHFDIVQFVLLWTITVCGALTHYYFIVYAFFISLVMIFVMLTQKRFKEIICYVLVMGSAGGAALLIFPAIIDHLFKGGRGIESIENLRTSNLGEQLKNYIDIINQILFGKFLGLMVIIIVFLLAADIVIYEKNEDKNICHFNRIQAYRYSCLLLPSVCYVILVAKSAPYITDRYVAPIYTVLLAGMWGMLCICIKNVYGNVKVRNIFISFFATVVVIASLANSKWDYLYTDSNERLNNSQKYGATSEAVVLYDEPWKVNPYYLEVKNCQSSVFYNMSSYQQFKENVDINEFPDAITFFLVGMDSETFIRDFLADNSEYSVTVDNGTWAYGHSYYLRK